MALGDYDVVSFLPGRIRVLLPQIRKNKPLCKELEGTISKIPGVTQVKANPLTGRLLIVFEPEVKTHLEGILGFDLAPVVQAPSDHKVSDRDFSLSLLSSVTGQAFTAVFTGVAFIYSLFARLLFGPSEDMGPLSLPFAVQSGSSLLLGYPPLRSMMEKAPRIGLLTGPLATTFTAILVSMWRKNSLGLFLGLLLGLSSFAHTDLSAKSVQKAKKRSDEKRATKGLPTCTPETVAKSSLPDEESREWLHIPSDLPELESYARNTTKMAFSWALFLFVLTGDWTKSLAVLLVSNPRSAYTSATVSMAAILDVMTDRGILVRRNRSLSRISRIEKVYIECEGVLTAGIPQVAEIAVLDPTMDTKEVVSYALILTRGTDTPVEKAIAKWAEENQVKPKAKCLRSTPRPHGILGEINGVSVGFGTPAFLRAKGVSTRKARLKMDRLSLMGCDVFGLSLSGVLVAVFGIKDQVTEKGLSAIEAVRSLGFPDIHAIKEKCSDHVIADLGLLQGPGPEKGQKAILVGRSDDMLRYLDNSYLLLATEEATCDLMDQADLISTGSWTLDLPWLLRLGQRLKEITRQNVLVSSTVGLSGLILASIGRLPLYIAPTVNEIVNLLVAFNAERLLAEEPGPDENPGDNQDGTGGTPGSGWILGDRGDTGSHSHVENGSLTPKSLTPDDLNCLMPRDLTMGLDSSEAALRFRQFGANELTMAPPPRWFDLFKGQFSNIPTKILVLVGGISGLTGHLLDSAAIGMILVLNAALGASQEYRSEKTLSAMQGLLAPKARVIRDGEEMEIDAAKVVPGDVLALKAGDKVPGDALVFDCEELLMEEASLTGESVPVPKKRFQLNPHQFEIAVSSVRAVDPDYTQPLSLRQPEDSEMVFMGTNVVRGKARAFVISTGMATQMGRIVTLMQSGGEGSSPLQSKYQEATKALVYISLVAGGVVTMFGVATGLGGFLPMTLMGLSVAVAAIPEGLPAVVNIALASGVERVARKGALVRRLSAMDTLGRVTVICSDKTGTITANKIGIQKIFLPGCSLSMDDIEEIKSNEDALWALTCGVICNEARNNGKAAKVSEQAGCDRSSEASFSGDAVDVAFLTAAEKLSLNTEEVREAYREVYLLPFESDRAYMSILCSGQDGRTYLFIKGAPEVVMDMCSKYRLQGVEKPMTEDIKEKVENEALLMGKKGYKVIAVAYKVDPSDGLVLAGLFGMTDPPRPDVKSVVEKCRKNGLGVAMVTGDYPETAKTIAKMAGILDENGLVLTGGDVDAMDDKELDSIVSRTQVFARVKPSHKLRIVNSLKRLGHVVVMTGDGVNDAPAVKWADVGFAMGAGTEVTKDASAVVLTDDCFATISNAVDEGRIIRENIHSALEYLVTGNLGEVLLMALSILAGLPAPLIPLQILLVNLFTDALPALALALRDGSNNKERESWREAQELGQIASGVENPMDNRAFLKRVVRRGTVIGLSSALSFWLSLRSGGGVQKGMSIAFASIVGNQFLQLYHWPSLGLEKGDCFKEPTMRKMLGLSWLSFLSSLYFPPLAGLFGFRPLGAKDWILSLGPSLLGASFISIIEGRPEKREKYVKEVHQYVR